MSPKKWWHFLILFVVVGTLVLTALTALAVSIIYPTLPSLEILTNYRPKLSLKIYSAEGALIGEFGEERRAFVKIENVPASMKDAVLAIEDRRFYQHNGIDTKGIVRAIRNNVMGVSHEGASTITMQVAKNFFSQPGGKRDMITKIKEALLAIKIEKTISKDQILELYLNQIYLGQRSYGFAAASQVYFGKQLKDLNLAEAALLAGMPKAPSRYNPYTHEKRAMVRQNEVLRDMLRYGFIQQNEFDKAMNTKLKFKPAKSVKNLSADYVAEIVRISMFNRYGEDIYQSGYKVYTTIKKSNQEAANAAVVQGIIDYELRHGYRGPEKTIAINTNGDLKTFAVTALDEIEEYNRFVPALVTQVSKKSISAITKSGDNLEVTGAGLKLIEKHLLSKVETPQAVKVGAIIRVTKLNGEWIVVQLPQVEASLIALNPETGAVNALIGGFDFTRSKFNHVTQAWRQPGSSFKPFVYSAAIEKGFTPASVVDDAPFSLSAEEVGSRESWEPHNFDDKYSGPIRLRTALTKSKNMVSIRVLQAIGPRYAQSYITKFGFNPKDHPAYLAMALGAGSTTSWQLAAGYAVFANSGYQVKPYLISKIVDSDGRVVESVDPTKHISAYRVIDQRNAFLMTSMMQDVINLGTARQANVLGRSDIAGKTGTTNNQMDVWFAGFNPKEVAVAWMGYDSPKSLGRDETGGKAALPIWIKYMESALKGVPIYQYKIPQGVVKLKINPDDGTLAGDFDEGVDEYFYHENPPPSASYDIPSLEGTTEQDYARPNSMDMITNPMQPNSRAAPVEERRLDGAQKTEKPRREPSADSETESNPLSRIFNSGR
ncbi:penicillin-binding protein 1A [Methylotenera sp. 1P/1]|jgi:penicillin-binding protein 1A|uniref:penicillin-binding protein 1A n=1 Tax=Methylotenera sp. 1P/1 TaxID=1131551 RepID=UPI00036DD802|nr:PBP1A family penicillin-binding protein [Methylotenera sp. 1P/1]